MAWVLSGDRVYRMMPWRLIPFWARDGARSGIRLSTPDTDLLPSAFVGFMKDPWAGLTLAGGSPTVFAKGHAYTMKPAFFCAVDRSGQIAQLASRRDNRDELFAGMLSDG